MYLFFLCFLISMPLVASESRIYPSNISYAQDTNKTTHSVPECSDDDCSDEECETKTKIILNRSCINSHSWSSSNTSSFPTIQLTQPTPSSGIVVIPVVYGTIFANSSNTARRT